MHLIAGVLLLIGGIVLSGCDSELEAEEQISLPLEVSESLTVEPKDNAYWEQVVFGSAPSVADGPVISDPFEPIIVEKRSPVDEVPVPPAEATTRPIIETIEDRIQVAGIIQGRVPVAILRNKNDEQLVEEGDQIEGCTVQSIQRDRVILSGEGRTWTLEFQGTEW